MQLENIEELINDYSNQSYLTDAEIRQIAVNSLAEEFLQGDASIEQRIYMAETTISPVVLSIERLLREVSKQRPPTLVNHLETDFPKKKFNCINWLGIFALKQHKICIETISQTRKSLSGH
jgi:hypothetical protein